MAPAVLAGLPRTGNVTAGPARRERSGKAGPGLARDLGELNVCTVEETDDTPAQVGNSHREKPVPEEAAQPGPVQAGVRVGQWRGIGPVTDRLGVRSVTDSPQEISP